MVDVNDVQKVRIEDQQPWVEQYRPRSLTEIAGHVQWIPKLQQMVQSRQLPHLLFYGPPGTGKTSCLSCIVRSWYTTGSHSNEPRVGEDYLELNASDERTLDVIRTKLLPFCRRACTFTAPTASTASSTMAESQMAAAATYPRLILLDEMDSMPVASQQSLRRVMEKYHDRVRFLMTCNDLTRIVDTIQSRSLRLFFGRLESNEMRARLQHIVQDRKLTKRLTADAMDALLFTARGDLRGAINHLQSLAHSTANGPIHVELVYATVDQPQPYQLHELLNACVQGHLRDALRMLQQLHRLGHSSGDILSGLLAISTSSVATTGMTKTTKTTETIEATTEIAAAAATAPKTDEKKSTTVVQNLSQCLIRYQERLTLATSHTSSFIQLCGLIAELAALNTTFATEAVQTPCAPSPITKTSSRVDTSSLSLTPPTPPAPAISSSTIPVDDWTCTPPTPPPSTILSLLKIP